MNTALFRALERCERLENELSQLKKDLLACVMEAGQRGEQPIAAGFGSRSHDYLPRPAEMCCCNSDGDDPPSREVDR